MIFAEPGRTDYDLHFRFFGIPVRVHPMFWLVGLIFSSSFPDVQHILIFMAAFFVSILTHELGHALTFQWYGVRSSIVLYGFGGLTIPSGVVGPQYHQAGTSGRILIDFAGTGLGFLVVLLILGGMYSLGYGNRIEFVPLFRVLPPWICLPAVDLTNHFLTFFVNCLLRLWIYWGVLNLLPVYPLDGGQISQEICVALSPREGIPFSLKLSAATAGVIAAGICWLWLKNFDPDQAVSMKDMLRSFPLLTTLLFAYLSYQSFLTLQAYRNHRGW